MPRTCVSRLRDYPTLTAIRILLLAGPLLLGLVLAAIAEESSGTVSDSLSDDVAAKRKQLAEQIGKLIKENGDHSTESVPQDVSTSEDELEYLQSLDEVYAQQQARLEQRQELQAAKKKAEEELASLRKFGPTEPKPYSFLILERFRDDLAAEEDQEDAFTTDVKVAEQSLESAHSHFDQAEKDRRRVQEESATHANKPQDSAQAVALELARRQSQVAKELILLRRLEVEVRTLRRDVSTSRTTQLNEKIEHIAKNVQFTKLDLQDRLREIVEAEAEFNRQLKEARSQFQQLDLQQGSAIKDLQDHKMLQSTIDLAIESWRVARDAQQMKMSLLNERISDIKRFHHYWACRYETENGSAKPAEIAEWHEGLGNLVDEIRDNQRSLQQHIESARLEQAKLVQCLRDNDDPKVKQWSDFQCAQWQELRDVCEAHLVQLKVDERWSTRFLGELEAKIQPHDSESWWNISEKRLATLWVFELATVGDRPITIGKVIDLLLCIMLSLVSASILSRLLGRRLLPHLGLNGGASRAVQSIAFYSLALLFSVVSFELVHIPLASFAFLGGAVAIAVGFGSQDIANNFMSGIILLAEQPIRVGDVITVDDVQGTVQHIGPRSTRIRTDLNHELIVPNSKLLSDKVTNLTLSDNLVQTAVAVSLPVKISVSRAKHLLLQAASSNPLVLRDPHPIVLFKQLGTTSMDFELHFWLRLSHDMQVAIAQSDVRESVNELLEQFDAQPTIAATLARNAA